MKFSKTKKEMALIRKIANRAVTMAKKAGVQYHQMDAEMDISACHNNGNALKLQELLQSDDVNFGHDIFGIRHYLNRETGELTDCFVPRFSARDITEGKK